MKSEPDQFPRRTVLITRPEPDATALAEQLEDLGCDAIRAPLLEIRYTGEAPDLGDVAALAFTSANGVRALVHALPEAAAGRTKVFAVGDATARAAREAGFEDITAAAGDVASLADTIASASASVDRSGAVLHVAGRDRAGDLIGLLENKGIAARRTVLYTAEPAEDLPAAARDALARGVVDDVVIFSPRTARQFVTLIEKAGLSRTAAQLRLVALSDNVARAAAGLEFESVAVASRPDQGALLNLFALQNVQAAMSDSDNSPDKETDKAKDAGNEKKKGKTPKITDVASPDETSRGASGNASGPTDAAAPYSPFADTPSASEDDSAAPESAAPRRRFPIGLAVLAVVVIAAAAAGWAATQPEVRQWVAARLAPVPSPDQGAAEAELRARLDSLERRVQELTAGAGQATEDDRVPALAARLDEVSRQVAELDSRAPAEVVAPERLTPIEERLGTLSDRLDAVTARTERLAGANAAARDARIAVLGFVSALETGRPFGAYAGAVESRLADLEPRAADAFETVKPAAARGVPTTPALAARAAALTLTRSADQTADSGAISKDGEPDNAGAGLWERVQSRIAGLVTIRRVDENGAVVEAPSPPPGLAPVRAALGAGDLEAAALALDAIDRGPLSDGARVALDALARDVALRRAANDLAHALDGAVAASTTSNAP